MAPWEWQDSNATQDGSVFLFTGHRHLIERFCEPSVNRKVSQPTSVLLLNDPKKRFGGVLPLWDMSCLMWHGISHSCHPSLLSYGL